MEETKHCTNGRAGRFGLLYGAGAFLLGAVVALAFGWGIFPDLMFSARTQPIAFSHAVHADQQEIGCFTCHNSLADGSFSGLPTVETCAGCHQDVPPEPAADAPKAKREQHASLTALVTTYIQGGKELVWQAHQRQPDNVFFSHAAHFNACFSCHLTMKGGLNMGTPDDPRRLCMRCHPSLAELNSNMPVQENILTGYSRTTMKMWQCESCHAFPGHFSDDGAGRTAANNACYTCHK
ncbi:MAG: cytochrome c family protein [Desulfovibrio sp.]|jgi:hypothetical protein|nr:cytochrome c family protein [Desulfovibrio sp.]